MSDIADLVKRLRELADGKDYLPEDSDEAMTLAATRLERIAAAWVQYDGAAVQDIDVQMDAYESLRAAIEGHEP